MHEHAWAKTALLAMSAVVAACGHDGGGSDTDGMTDGAANTDGMNDGKGGAGDNDGGDGDDGNDGNDDGDMEYPPVPGIFVAVGDGGRRAWSSDGETWEVMVGTGGFSGQTEDDVPDQLIGACAGDGYVLAVGGGGTQYEGNTLIMRSEDGATWDEDLVPTDDQAVQLMGCAIGSEVAVAVGRRSRVYLSADRGETWGLSKEFHHNGVGVLRDADVAEDGTIVAVGQADPSDEESSRMPAVVFSRDAGETWDRHIFDENDPIPSHVASGDGRTVILAGNTCLYSDDLASWEDCDLPAVDPAGLLYFNDQFWVYGADYFAASEDGTSWDVTQMVFGGMPSDVAHGEGRYVGVQWGRRGWAEDPTEWTYEMDFVNPLVSVAFLPD